jgi:hypothetical protein
MIVHKAQHARAHDKSVVVGSVSNPTWQAPKLLAELAVWDQEAIDDIEDDTKSDLSCGYHYRADMTPGTYQGKHFDGRMVDITGNHVTFVTEGRVPSAFVGDSAINPRTGAFAVAKTAGLSRKALYASGALRAYLAPKLAQDAKIDLSKIVAGSMAANWAASKPTIVARIKTATKNKLAQDADLGDIVEMLDQLDDVVEEVVDDPAADEDDDMSMDDAMMEKVCKFLEGKIKPEEMEALKGMMKPPAQDETPEQKAEREKKEKEAKEKPPAADKEEPPVSKAAMDAAIATAAQNAAKAAEKATITRLNDIREAERVVRPYIGELAMAQDSAEAVYRLALESLPNPPKLEGVHPSAFRVLLEAHPKPGDAPKRVPSMAHDSAANADFDKRFPGASRIRTV